jgi:hypothetical protein
VCLALLGAFAHSGHADTTTLREDPEHHYQITLGPAWLDKAAAIAATGAIGDRPALLAGYEHPRSGALVAVTRINYPNLGAWRARTRPAYVAAIEQGVREAVVSYRRLEQRTGFDQVPVFDLVFRSRRPGGQGKQGNEIVAMRFLFFRTYSLVMTVTVPARAYRRHKRTLRAVQNSFKPYL